MRQGQNLYEYLYQMLITQFLNGAFQAGRAFPSQREICLQYNVGITTVRKVMKLLDEQGYIRTAQGQPSVVTYQAAAEDYAAYLVRRRDEIADAYRGLELLMPALYREGARRCGEPELRRFRALLEGISEQMELTELYQQANAFFVTLLRTMNNRLIMDLELDSENYLHIPYIPMPGVENPFALTADRLRIWMKTVVSQVENQQLDDFYAGIARLYRESAKRVDDYLLALGGHTPVQLQTKGEMHWFRPKGRSELYARLAMIIIRRLTGGDFDGQKYLPSILKLMEEYGVMKDTASRAVALLNSLGFARTLDKKGTKLAIDGFPVEKSGIDLTEPVIQEQLTLFMEALQIVALTAEDCGSSFSSVPDNLALFLEERLPAAQDSRISPLSFQLLLHLFIELMPYHSLKNIFQQLEELLIWGYYLQAADSSLYPDSADTFAAMKEVAADMKNGDHAGLPATFGKVFSLVYQDAITVLSRLPDGADLSGAAASAAAALGSGRI